MLLVHKPLISNVLLTVKPLILNFNPQFNVTVMHQVYISVTGVTMATDVLHNSCKMCAHYLLVMYICPQPSSFICTHIRQIPHTHIKLFSYILNTAT